MQFRKKPVVVEAQQFTTRTGERILRWIGSSGYASFVKELPVIKIDTLEGIMMARHGDWIIKGVQGEFYPCKPDIFLSTYEPVKGEPT